MRFGIIKTLVENKLVESFKNDALKTDMYLFNKKLLKNKDFVKMMSIYDNLNENKGLDKETSNYLVEDMVSEFKNLNESSISARGENHQSSGDCRNAKLKNIILGLTVANAMDSR
jgi:hypothetical protein